MEWDVTFIPMEKKIRELNLQGLCWDLGSYCFLGHAFNYRGSVYVRNNYYLCILVFQFL